MKSIKAIFRRGQISKAADQAQGGGDLSRTSSISNLNAASDPKSKGALSKNRKSASRDKLDKVGEKEKKHDKKGKHRRRESNTRAAGFNRFSGQV